MNEGVRRTVGAAVAGRVEREALGILREGFNVGDDRRQWKIRLHGPKGELLTMTLEEAAGGSDRVALIFN